MVAAFLLLTTLSGLLGDWFWFTTIGYDTVFLTILTTSFILWIISFAVFFGFSYWNAVRAARTAAAEGAPGRRETPTPVLVLALTLMGSLWAAFSVAGSWETVLRYIHQTPFSVTDPLFSTDIGFYVFSLPFYSLIVNFLFILFIFTTILSVVSFLIHSPGFGLRFQANQPPIVVEEGGEGFDPGRFMNRIISHLNIPLFLIFTALAAKLWLARFNLLLSPSGVVFGAGYTDVHVTLPVLTILSVLALIMGIGFLVNEKIRRTELVTYGVAAFMCIAIIGLIAGGVMQSLVVEPDEFNMEEPYLENNIQNTLAAYNIKEAQAQTFPINYSLTSEDIRANSGTVENIRLWDWRPLKSTYEQLQLFRTYYTFNDVDVDRYMIDGHYKEVLISAREINIQNLPEQAQTWINTHMVYTHGYGAVMNPVDVVTPDGLPEFYLKDIPPSQDYFTLEEPRIYYGEKTANYVVTETSTDEFDYPAGEENMYTTYDGAGGVALSDGLRKFVYALQYGSVELLVSGSLKPESRLLMHRSVSDRVNTIAPFLSYDPDPYLVTADGRLFWIIDAYTTTDMYPYSEPVRAGFINGGWQFNYIRNSVKVVVDAYNGDVTYYVIDNTDPVIQTYQKMFPEMFRDISEMPASLVPHIRYPQGLFEIQVNRYATYHMEDPRVFYNMEDVWVIPDEIYRGSRQQMEPYYIIMKLPGEASEEFILMLPFTPRGKENMIGWLAARSDPPHYGELVVYQFSKQELTYGPMQIEARIDQDTEISQHLTLWSQSGSSVVRGNTLIIPIEGSIIYVEPLYLEATERGTLPQMKRVIVAYEDRLTMEENLPMALDVIFGEGAGTKRGGEVIPPVISQNDAEKIAQILEVYAKAQGALDNGELGLYQQYIDEIGRIAAA